MTVQRAHLRSGSRLGLSALMVVRFQYQLCGGFTIVVDISAFPIGTPSTCNSATDTRDQEQVSPAPFRSRIFSPMTSMDMKIHPLNDFSAQQRRSPYRRLSHYPPKSEAPLTNRQQQPIATSRVRIGVASNNHIPSNSDLKAGDGLSVHSLAQMALKHAVKRPRSDCESCECGRNLKRRSVVYSTKLESNIEHVNELKGEQKLQDQQRLLAKIAVQQHLLRTALQRQRYGSGTYMHELEQEMNLDGQIRPAIFWMHDKQVVS